jgi:hypothetical protein
LSDNESADEEVSDEEWWTPERYAEAALYDAEKLAGSEGKRLCNEALKYWPAEDVFLALGDFREDGRPGKLREFLPPNPWGSPEYRSLKDTYEGDVAKCHEYARKLGVDEALINRALILRTPADLFSSLFDYETEGGDIAAHLAPKRHWLVETYGDGNARMETARSDIEKALRFAGETKLADMLAASRPARVAAASAKSEPNLTDYLSGDGPMPLDFMGSSQ